MDDYLMIMTSIETAQDEICKRLDKIIRLLKKLDEAKQEK